MSNILRFKNSETDPVVIRDVAENAHINSSGEVTVKTEGKKPIGIVVDVDADDVWVDTTRVWCECGCGDMHYAEPE